MTGAFARRSLWPSFRSILCRIAILSGLLGPGCEGNHYRVEMSVDGSALNRKLTCWRQSGGDENDRPYVAMPEAELQRIADAYGVDVPATAKREFEFSGRFEGTTPNDIGGKGALTMWTSNLGRSWAYVERFRGNDDLVNAAERRRAALEDLLRLLTDWLHTELGDGQDFEKVRQFIQGELRRDLENVTEYSATAGVLHDLSGDTTHDDEFGLRIAQYAAERGYFELQELPNMIAAVEQGDAPALLAWIRSILAAKLGRDELGDEWNFLSTKESLEESLNRSLQEHPLQVESRNERVRRNPDSEPPPPIELVAALLIESLRLDLGGFDGLEVTLQCPAEPYRMNGEWFPSGSLVRWNRQLEEIGDEPRQSLPALLFAFWSVPDFDFQSARFGRVIIQDQALDEYCRWHAELSPDQGRQWDEFIDDLEGGSAAGAEIERFRFVPHDEASERLVQRGRDLLLTALNAGE